ncbi:MAG: hypothetical protein RLZZ44_1279 [Bacteroidota bacterium]
MLINWKSNICIYKNLFIAKLFISAGKYRTESENVIDTFELINNQNY